MSEQDGHDVEPLRGREGRGDDGAEGRRGMSGRNPAGRRQLPNRRDVIALGVGAFLVSTLPLARRRHRLVRRSVPVMGTIAEFAVVHRDPRYAHAAIDAALAELERIERTMTRFRPTSDVGRANLGAAAAAVPVSRETALVLEEAVRWAEASDGAFDPCLERAVVMWDVTHRHEPPPGDRVRRLAGRRLYRALEIDTWRGAPVVRFRNKDAGIDLGGIAKGYGVDRATHALRDWGIRHALVNVGGDLYALGSSEDGDPWQIGIRSPVDPRRLAGSVEISDRAVATSGDYQQFFEYRGRRYHHILDPATGEPRRSEERSVTVMADTCMAADAAATAVFGMAQSEMGRLLRLRAPDAQVVRAG
ncbi:MAG: FAD:protein FMN transferase [Gemmatimonadetes bacterium]|nr:FAD:protein FMN transferase [Gemmatimonadota bacterium]